MAMAYIAPADWIESAEALEGLAKRMRQLAKRIDSKKSPVRALKTNFARQREQAVTALTNWVNDGEKRMAEIEHGVL